VADVVRTHYASQQEPVLGRLISLKLMWFFNFAFMYNALYYVLGPIGRAPPLASRGSLQEVVLNWHLQNVSLLGARKS
jgi:hypothetical protein